MRSKLFCCLLALLLPALLLTGCKNKEQELQEYLESADAAYSEGDYDTAIEDYTKALELDENNAVIYNNRGLAYSDSGESQAALADFLQATSLEQNAIFFGNLGSVYMDLQDYADAEASYSQAITLDPEEGLYYLGRAYAYEAQEEVEAAISDYDEALALGVTEAAESNALLLNNQGTDLYSQEQYEEAIAHYSKAIELDPDNPLFYWNRAESYRQEGKDQEAVSDYVKHLELAGSEANEEIYSRIGLEYARLEDYASAESYLETATLHDPENSDVIEVLGDCYYKEESWKKAASYYSQYLEQVPDAIVYGKLGDCYYQRGKYKKAVDCFTKSLDLNVQYAWAYYMRAESYMELGEYELAQVDYGKAEELK